MQNFLSTNKEFLLLLGGMISFIFGVYQYIQLQRTKQIENLFKIRSDIENFMAQQNTKTIHVLTDYVAYTVDSLSYREKILRNVYLCDPYVSYALRPHGKNSRFHPFEACLRERYDNYFTELEKYYYYVKIGVFDVDFLRPYLGYYIGIQGTINSDKIRKRQEDIQALHNYMRAYFPVNLIKLYKKFGYKIQYKEIPYEKPAGYEEWLRRIDLQFESPKDAYREEHKDDSGNLKIG